MDRLSGSFAAIEAELAELAAPADAASEEDDAQGPWLRLVPGSESSVHPAAIPDSDVLADCLRQCQEPIEVLDPEGRIVFVNASWVEQTGRAQSTVLGRRPFAPRLDGRHESLNRRMIAEAIAARRAWRGSLQLRSGPSGSSPRDVSLTPIHDETGDVLNFLVLWRQPRAVLKSPVPVRAATPRSRPPPPPVAQGRSSPGLTRSEEQVTRKISRMDFALEGARDGLWDADVFSGELWLSRRTAIMLGRGQSEVVLPLSEWRTLFHPDQIPQLTATIDRLRGRDRFAESDCRVVLKDGTEQWFSLKAGVMRDHKGTLLRVSGAARNVTRRKKTEEALEHAAYHDALCRLPNRALFVMRLDRALGRLKGKQNNFAVLFIDMNHFKLVNDRAGHSVGDQLLVAVCDRLRTCLRPSDTLARIGGDEFALLVEELPGREMAMELAERIHDELKPVFTFGEHEFFASVSIGIAYGSQGHEDADQVLHAADSAMYQAKARGPGRTFVFSQGLLHANKTRLELDSDLRSAIDNDELALMYQPIVRLTDGRFLGYEALVRWDHPTRGRISPNVFIPLAEENGLIIDVGRWVLERACADTARLREEIKDSASLSVSVNMSPQHLRLPDIVDEVTRVLLKANLPPAALRLEITERTTVGERSSAAQTLERFRYIGVQVDVDDFGTGYSSLSYLTQLPVHTVKIDGSFVRRLGPSGDARKLVRAIVMMSHSLDLCVTAEGIENVEQLDVLRRLGCDKGQGHLISRPVTFAALKTLLARGAAW